MKITSAEIKNYRIHKDLSVTFDDRLTIISGPNESGKSTLAEALHRGLFLRSRAGGATREKMLPRDGAVPEVTLTLELSGRRVIVRKVFNGTRGTTRLDVEGEASLSGDEADEKLARLLLTQNALGANETALSQRWAHLWIWQGSSGVSPLHSVMEAKPNLVSRLNALGGAAMAQSELDDQVIRALLAKRDEIYTQNGKDFRTNSEPGQAAQRLEAARALFDEHAQAVARLDTAIHDSESASRTLQEKGITLEIAQRDLKATQQKVQETEQLKKAIEPLATVLEEAEQELKHLQQVTEEILKDRQDLEKATSESKAYEAQLQALLAKQEACSTELNAASQTLAALQSELERHKIRLDALRDQRILLQKQTELRSLTDRITRMTTLQDERDDLRRPLELLPAITQKDLAALNKLRDENLQAQSARDALGACVRHVAGDTVVTVGDVALPVNEECLLTEDADIRVGETFLHITLGGVSNLRDATAALDAAAKKLEKRLQELGCATLQAALEAHERRKVLQDRMASLEERIEEYDPERLQADLLSCRRELDRATARLSASQYETSQLPTDLEILEQEFNQCDGCVKEAESRLQPLQRLCKQWEEEKKKAETSWQTLSDKWQTRRDAAIRITAGLEAKIALHGTDEARAERRLKLQVEHEQSGESLKLLSQQLQELQPDLLASDLKRLEETIQQAETAIQEAKIKHEVAAKTLFLDGNSDPHAALVAAKVAYERAEQRNNQLKAQAEAIKYLAELGTSLQKEISMRINQPLEEKAKAYLETVFGPGATLTFSTGLQSNETPKIEIERPGLGRFTFDELSAGAHEQVGVALRLAMAEVLAEDHNGSLPIILDDAFVNSDPDRVRSLHRMLYLAAEHGLQIIVLTCNPADYNTLGATEVRLEEK